MNHSKSEIEELTRSQLQGAETTPPDGLWERIGSQIGPSPGDAGATHTVKGGLFRRTGFWLTTAAVLAAGSVATAVVLSLDDAPQTTVAVENRFEDEPAFLASASADTAPVVAEDALARQSVSPAQKGVSTPPAESTVHETAASAVAQPDPVSDSRDAEVVAMDSEMEADRPADEVAAEPPSPVVDTAYAHSAVTTRPVVDNPAHPSADVQLHREADATLLFSNVLTPNGDGINDCWVIHGLDRYSHVQVQIFTGRGKRVYHSSNYQNDFCGDDLPDGNYFYFITIRDINYSRRGALVIRR